MSQNSKVSVVKNGVELAGHADGEAYIVEPCAPEHDCGWVAWLYDDPTMFATADSPADAVANLLEVLPIPVMEADDERE